MKEDIFPEKELQIPNIKMPMNPLLWKKHLPSLIKNEPGYLINSLSFLTVIVLSLII